MQGICVLCDARLLLGNDMRSHFREKHPEVRWEMRKDRGGHTRKWCRVCGKQIQSWEGVKLHTHPEVPVVSPNQISPGEKAMPVKIFQPSQHKEEIKQLLRDGITVEECATRFPLSERTIYRYLGEVQHEEKGKTPPEAKPGAINLSEIDAFLNKVDENMAIVEELRKTNKELRAQVIHYATRIIELQNLLASDTAKLY